MVQYCVVHCSTDRVVLDVSIVIESRMCIVFVLFCLYVFAFLCVRVFVVFVFVFLCGCVFCVFAFLCLCFCVCAFFCLCVCVFVFLCLCFSPIGISLGSYMDKAAGRRACTGKNITQDVSVLSR